MLNIRKVIYELSGFKTITVCLFILNILSVMSIYSSLHQAGEFVGGELLSKQIIWIGISWVLLVIFTWLNYRLYFSLGYLIYVLNLILIIAVDIFGMSAMGAQRWLSIFGFTFQPSEISKVAVIILLARLFSETEESNSPRSFFVGLLLVILSAIVIFKQPDLGTAIIIVLIFLTMGFFSKINKIYFILCIGVGLLLTPVFFGTLKDYQKKRLLVFINPNVDPLGAGYTIIQSKIAVGSGRIFGKGFLSGTQNQLNFLPERHTDFIFTVIAEEWGFFGSLFLILIYWLILQKILDKTKELHDPFAYFLSLGIVLLFFLHIFINIGMTLGILPVVGVPLVFLSYGGTNLLINFILIGIFFNICRQHT